MGRRGSSASEVFLGDGDAGGEEVILILVGYDVREKFGSAFAQDVTSNKMSITIALTPPCQGGCGGRVTLEGSLVARLGSYGRHISTQVSR